VLVDPKLPGCRYPFKELCGAGIAWKLAEALFIHSGERVGVDAAGRRRWLASLAKIAALSTVADMVPLTGENRVLVSWGLAGLADPRAPGLAALLKRAGVPVGRAPSTREVAFRIAPRLNAMGRLDHAARAFELLTTTDAARAEVLAGEIEAANDERRVVQERVIDVVLARLAGGFDAARDAIVVEAGDAADGWHRGVLGIAASRVAKELARPVLLLAREGDVVSGSGRSYGKTPLFERLAPVARRYTSELGGHAAALGLTLPAASFEAFRDDLRAAFAEARDEEEWAEELFVDTEVEAAEADEALARALERFEPHGQENPKPLLGFRGLEWDGRGRAVGERGLRVALASNGRRLEAVGWTLADIPPAARAGRVDVAANLAIDSYTGRPSLTVVDLAPAAP
jgi:single-stranded-DNA-specific exonuclease